MPLIWIMRLLELASKKAHNNNDHNYLHIEIGIYKVNKSEELVLLDCRRNKTTLVIQLLWLFAMPASGPRLHCPIEKYRWGQEKLDAFEGRWT